MGELSKAIVIPIPPCPYPIITFAWSANTRLAFRANPYPHLWLQALFPYVRQFVDEKMLSSLFASA
jgi:hypothetical protein